MFMYIYIYIYTHVYMHIHIYITGMVSNTAACPWLKRARYRLPRIALMR